MAFDNLNDREKQILYNLVSHYIKSADPVGSRIIANKFKMGISSATIRNTLQDLEEIGLVQQPHTSAGRIPTDMGYRVYVDYLVKPEMLSAQEEAKIRQTILKEGKGINEILGQTCKVLGEITNQLGVSIAPRFNSGILKRIDLIPVSDEKIMAVVVVESGLARTVIIEIETNISEKVLKDFEAALNERLAGLTLGVIKDSISDRLTSVKGDGRLIKLIVDSNDKIWTEERSEDFHIAGTDRLLSQPEFANVNAISEFLKIIEDGKILSDFLQNSKEEGIIITIGNESRINEIMNCSLVTTTYKVGNVSGSIGIVGPTRMPYSKLVSVVECAAKTITEALSGYQKS